jgi:hypothetical protein
MAASKAGAAMRRKPGHMPAGQARAGRAAAAAPSESQAALQELFRKVGPTLLETYRMALTKSREVGREVDVIITVSPGGNLEVRQIKAGATEAGKKEDIDTALEAARFRGRAKVAEILSGHDMLSADEFGKLIGVSRMTVNAKRQKRQILGLEGAKRGFRFPVWQIGENGKPFAVLPELFDRLGGSPWAVYRFLVQHHPELDGLTGCEALQRGETEKVIDAAESVARAFG